MVIRVWAPRAGRLELDIGGERRPMEPDGGGWWSCDAEPGKDYALVLDGGHPLPDPRSMWQPDGVHGRSRLIDHRAFDWTDRNWIAPPLSQAVIYELHIGTFTQAGSFESARAKLAYLKELGITHVELMPVGEFSGNRGWGYDGVDLYAPHHAYGAPQDLKRLVDTCHSFGLAVLLDVVYNHFGPSGNYLPQFGPYLTHRYATPWGDAVNLDDAESDEVRRFFCDNALMWLRDYHFDGLRIDAVHALFDQSAVHFLEQLAAEVAALQNQIGRRLVLIAESDLNDPRVVRTPEIGGYGIEAQWSDDFHHSLHAFLTGERNGYYADFGKLADIAKALRHAFVYDGRYSNFRRRRHGRLVSRPQGSKFLGYSQTHDQVGNRAQGDRSSQLMSVDKLKVAAALVMTSAFVPMLFQGEEWGASTPFLYFTGHPEAELGKAVTEGRQREFAAFGWDPNQIPDPQDPNTFRRSKLNWSERELEPHRTVLNWYKELIALRRQTPELSDGRLDLLEADFDENRQWLKATRGRTITVYNFASESRGINVAPEVVRKIALASDQRIRADRESLLMPPDSVAILLRDSK